MEIKACALSNVRSRGHLVVPMFAPTGKTRRTSLGVSLSGAFGLETAGETVEIAAAGGGFESITVLSLGPRSGCGPDGVRRGGGTIAKVLDTRGRSSVTVDMSEIIGACDSEGVEAFCEGLALGSFRFDTHKTNSKKRQRTRVTLALPDPSRSVRARIRKAALVCAGVNYARSLAHEPANVINPVTLAARARAMARAAGLKCTIVDHREMRRQGMGAMLAVGQASASPPRLIVVEYGADRAGKPIVLIGKAVTFDTGGYSLKDRNGMVGMKYDKCGGTAVLGVMHAIARLKPKVRVIGIVAAAENMIGGNAYRPNDVIRSMSGKTIEVISTDAEGRLVLADALTFAQKRFKPRAMIDLATLTGGVVVALGQVLAGVFCNDDGLRDRLVASGDRTFERLWPLPMHDEYFELIQSDDCDFKNSASREAHASVGAVFLKQFVDGGIPWAHLDIAGVASIDKPAPYCPKGGTGFGVRLLCDYLEGL